MKDEHRYSLIAKSFFVNSFPNFTEKISAFSYEQTDKGVTVFSK